jgi:hypothetical protein
MSVVVDTSDHIYDDFSRLLFLHAHREASALVNELPQESDKFRYLYTPVSVPQSAFAALRIKIHRTVLDLEKDEHEFNEGTLKNK